MSTVIGLNDARAVKLWSAELFVSVSRESYWMRKYMGKGEGTPMPIMLLTELEKNAGDQIQYELSVQISGEPIEGDAKAEGNGTQLRSFTDRIYIDQARKPVSCGGRMTRKRTVHDLRAIGRDRLRDYWARFCDEQYFMYAAGARGINPDYNVGLGYTGRAANPFQAPDADHIVFGDGSSKATLTTAGTMSRAVVEKVNTKAASMGGGSTDVAELQPIRVGGGEYHVLVMHPFQFHSLKTSTATGDWLDIQKAAAAAEGKNNPIFTGMEGMIGGTVLHQHKAVTRFGDYGAGGNVAAARALFLGRQGLVCAFGSPGSGFRFDWSEKELDHGNDIEICAGAIFGVKRTQFEGRDFGLVSVDTAAVDPNA